MAGVKTAPGDPNLRLKRYLSFSPFLMVLFALPAFAQFNGDGLKGVYYLNPNLTNASVTVVDPLVSYRWGGCPPQPGMSGNSFSVRWTGQVEPAYSETYTFFANVNGGVSVIVNGQVVINQWADLPPPIHGYLGTVNLTAGVQVPIEVDYFTNGANPTTDLIQVGWQSASQGNENIPREYLFSGATLTPLPTPQTNVSCGAGVSVNGVLDEWPWSGSSGWATVNRTVLGNVYGTTATFKTLWDPANLYLGVTVTDSQLTNTGIAASWRNSAVELYLDNSDSRSVTITNNDFEYFFRWNDTAATETQGRLAGVTMRTTTLSTGYVLEASIPWSTLGVGSPGPGTALGFDLGVDVNHNGGDCRDGQLIWNGGSDDFTDTSGYAHLTLGSACPTPIATPPAPVGGKPYVSPNPSAGGSVQFTYVMAKPGTAHIKVWNAWGNLAATIGEPKPAGLQSSRLDISAFAPGHYFYKVELDYTSGGSDKFETEIMAIQK